MMYWIRYEVRSYPLDWAVGVLFELGGLSQEAHALGRYPHPDLVLQVARQLPPGVLLQLVRRLFLRLSCFMVGSAQLYGSARADSLAAMVTAFRYGSVLLGLVQHLRSCANMLHDHFFLELFFLFRTPQVQERLRAVRAGGDTLLAGAAQQLFEAVLQEVGDAAPWERPARGPAGGGGGQAEEELSIAHLASRAVVRGMPGRVT
ncbi:hypothetical protein Agub_g1585 [Astrephomene gubernaculifera]|uniref:Uncharacterized protein n=1 Tax=Astrephomene gubernaculifera TaxID=47775 RepID=A0AAD3DGP2_9CHLO|nr:hypothetical protein Agub_g1585 [Astrephomene gubernaculifera]